MQVRVLPSAFLPMKRKSKSFLPFLVHHACPAPDGHAVCAGETPKIRIQNLVKYVLEQREDDREVVLHDMASNSQETRMLSDGDGFCAPKWVEHRSAMELPVEIILATLTPRRWPWLTAKSRKVSQGKDPDLIEDLSKYFGIEVAPTVLSLTDPPDIASSTFRFVPLRRYACGMPGCGFTANTKERVQAHRTTHAGYDDSLRPIWAILKAHMEATGELPRLCDMFRGLEGGLIKMDEDCYFTSNVTILSALEERGYGIERIGSGGAAVIRLGGKTDTVLNSMGCDTREANCAISEVPTIGYLIDIDEMNELERRRILSDKFGIVEAIGHTEEEERERRERMEREREDEERELIAEEERENRRERVMREGEFEEEVKEVLRRVNNKEDLNEKIREWDSVIVESEEKEDEKFRTVVGMFKKNGIDLPRGGWTCPLCKTATSYKDGIGWRFHMTRVHSNDIQGQQGLLWVGVGAMKKWEYEGVNVSEESRGKVSEIQYGCCPMGDCEFFCNRAGLTGHYTKVHKGSPELLNEFGEFWGTMIWTVRECDCLTEMKDWIRERESVVCPWSCQRHCGSKMGLKNHQNNCEKYESVMGKVKRVKGSDPLYEEGVIRVREFDSEREERPRDGERECERMQEEISDIRPEPRAAAEISDIAGSVEGEMEVEEVEEENVTAEERAEVERVIVEENVRDRKRRERMERAAKKRAEIRERLENERESREKESELEKQQRYMKWIEKYEVEEIGEDRRIPRLNKNRRIAISRGLKDKIVFKWTAMIRQMKIGRNQEMNECAIDGVTYKLQHDLRKHIKEALGLNKITVRPNNHRRLQTLRRRAQKKEQENRRSKARKLISLLEKHKEMLELNYESSDIESQNRLNETELRILQMTEEEGREWTAELFGGGGLSAVREFGRRSLEDREPALEWIRNRITSEPGPSSTRREIQELRENYEEDGRKTLRNSILRSVTPGSKMSVEELANHYGREWSQEEEFAESGEDSVWRRKREMMDEGELIKSITKAENIEKILETRNTMSATGLDKIGYGALKIFKRDTAILLSILFSKIIEAGYVPRSWRRSRTVFIFKKDDPNLPKNWRPIGITSCIYRVFTCAIAQSLVKAKDSEGLFDSSQKGFIPGREGCLEHASSLNELVQHTKRTGTEIFLMALDFTNAFGSVPHKLIFEQLQNKGIPPKIISVIRSIYHNNQTILEFGGESSEPINWRKGVIQGCPLSPILFNLCVDPLLNAIKTVNSNCGVFTNFEGRTHKHVVQAYADDVVIISESKDEMETLLQTVEYFCDFSHLKLAPHKCLCLALTNEDLPTFSIHGQQVQTMSMKESMRYLGCPISGWKSTRQKGTSRRIQEVTTNIETIIRSDLAFNQKLDAIKKFIIPTLDFALITSDVSLNELSKLDTRIRGIIDDVLRANHLPVSFFYLPISDGGLGFPNLRTRKLSNQITTLLKLVNSPDQLTSDLFRMSIQEEEVYRGVVKDQQGAFQGWKMEGEVLCQERESGTNGIAMRTNAACHKLKIGIRISGKRVVIKDLADPESKACVVATKDSRKIIKRIVRGRVRNDISLLPFHGHTFTTLRDNKVSNNLLATVRPVNDKLLRFLIMARNNQLLTPELKAVQSDDPMKGHCPVCNSHQIEAKGSLMHILNSCPSSKNIFKWRHNLVEETLVQEIKKKFPNVSIGRSRTLRTTGADLSDETKSLKPDITAITGNHLIIIEVNCPYGAMELRDDQEPISKLTIRHAYKTRKYQHLVEELKQKLDLHVTFAAVIVSSLGAVPQETINDLSKIFNTKETKTLAKKISYQAILGSAVIYHQTQPGTFGDPRHCPFIRKETVEGGRMEYGEGTGGDGQGPRIDGGQAVSQPPQDLSTRKANEEEGLQEVIQGIVCQEGAEAEHEPSTDPSVLVPSTSTTTSPTAPRPNNPFISRSASYDDLSPYDIIRADEEAENQSYGNETTNESNNRLMKRIEGIQEQYKHGRARRLSADFNTCKQKRTNKKREKRTKQEQKQEEEKLQRIYIGYLREQSEGEQGLSGEALAFQPIEL